MNEADKVELWRQRYFEAQAAAEEFVLGHHGQQGLDAWIEENAGIAARLLAVRPGVGTRAARFAVRLRDQLLLYDSDITLDDGPNGIVLHNHRCGILRYRRAAEQRGVNLTFDSPCDYCQQLNATIAHEFAAPESIACDRAGEGCTWRIAPRTVESFLERFPSHRAAVPTVHDPASDHEAFAAVAGHARHVIFNRTDRFRTAVVTGSNGKGSTASILSALLRAAGHRVGLISSPALRPDCTDMISVDGVPITPEHLMVGLESAEELLGGKASSEGVTHYMLICVAAYHHFREHDVDVVVAEPAIGGRHDTAVPFRPDVCLFTNVSLEHTDTLGPTVPEIAEHKSHIIGTGSIVVLGQEVAPEAAQVIGSRARDRNAQLVTVGGGTPNSSETAIVDDAGLRVTGGRHVPAYQLPNLRLAAAGFAALGCDDQAHVVDLDDPPLGLFPPNRFEVRARGQVTYVFDCAHNESGYAALVRSLRERFDPDQLTWIVGVTSPAALDAFKRTIRTKRATIAAGYHPRALAPPGAVDLPQIDFVDLEHHQVGGGAIVICGSFLVEPAKALLFPTTAAPSTRVAHREVGVSI
jgi:folylpolyglutamate synthase/dihydrofolate synthase